MKSRFRKYGRRFLKMIVLSALISSLISTTACSTRYVTVPGGDQVTLPKAQVDQLYQNNENLLQALEECQGGKQ